MTTSSHDQMRAHVDTWFRETCAAMDAFRQHASPALVEAAHVIATAIKSDGQILIFGNGGSAADAQHMAAEMVGRMLMERRRPLRAVALTTDTSALTAIANDYSYESVFEKQVQALGRAGDVAVAFSTSGNSPNVVKAVEAARQMNMKVISLTGGTGGRLAGLSDVSLNVAQGKHASMIQETHAIAIHLMVDLVDRFLLGDEWVARPG